MPLSHVIIFLNQAQVNHQTAPLRSPPLKTKAKSRIERRAPCTSRTFGYWSTQASECPAFARSAAHQCRTKGAPDESAPKLIRNSHPPGTLTGKTRLRNQVLQTSFDLVDVFRNDTPPWIGAGMTPLGAQVTTQAAGPGQDPVRPAGARPRRAVACGSIGG